MPRLVIAPQDVRDGTAITITDPPTLHRLLDVLRVREGDRIECADGAGRWYAARVARRSKRELVLDIVERGEEPRSPLAVRLLPALIKPERFDWLVQKTTELGVARISPVLTARSLIRVRGDRTEGRVARWERIAMEAAQQCGRAILPRIDAPVPFGELVSLLSSELGVGSSELVIMPTLTIPAAPLREVLAGRPGITSAAVLVGPEGDFTVEEVALAQRHGAIPVTLGRRTLRSETAAIAVLAILQHTAGEL
jgi:16S rRNA (uracil1498-N3)-methyltransferase